MRTTLTALALVVALGGSTPAQDGPAFQVLARYARALDANPDNAFYQYAVAQTARRLGVERPETRFQPPPRERWSSQLYEVTTGAAAVQESLQLDRIAGAGDVVEAPTVPVSSIEGVATPSIPFEKLRGDRTPVVEPLASVAPADWYYLHFTKASAMRRVLDAADRWGSHFLSAYAITGRDARVRQKLEAQTLLRATPELEPFYDLVVGDAILVGSDPFLAEGSDLTAVFTVKNALVFDTRLATDRRAAVAAASGASVIHEQYRAWMVDGVVSADHSLSTFSARKEGLAILSNSFEALRHVADVADGLAPSLAKAADFAYMRAIKPYADTDEDAFLFLSDAFVRRMVGPELKIGEARRVRCAVSLQTLAYAEMMFRTEQGRAPGSVDELVEARYVDMQALRCPDGGAYSLESGVPVCSIHGRQRYLKPNLEISIDRVGLEEARAYASFRENYTTYWRRYLDPVGVRIRAGAALDVDATILPLVENSIYNSAGELFGGPPVSLARPQAPDAVATLDLKLPPAARDSEFARELGRTFGVDATNLFGSALGDHATLQIADGAPLVQTDFAGLFGGPTGSGFDDWLFFSPFLAALTLPTAIVVPVRDRAALDRSLAELRAKIRASTGRDEWFDLDGYELVQGGTRTIEAVTIRFLVLRWRVYFTVVNDRLVLATDRGLLESLATGAPTGAEPAALRLELAPARWQKLQPSLALAYEEDARRVCLANVAWLDALRGSFGTAPRDADATALSLLGASFACPDRGAYVVGADGAVQCALHGTREVPRQGPRPQPGSPAAYVLEGVRRVEATLTFTPDGLTTRLRIE